MSTDSNRRTVCRDAHEFVGGTRPIRRIDIPDDEGRSAAHAVDERLEDAGVIGEESEIDKDGEVDFRIELGRTALSPEKLDELVPGCLLTLDNEEREPVQIFVRGCLVALGEIVIVDDHFGVRITQIVASPAS